MALMLFIPINVRDEEAQWSLSTDISTMVGISLTQHLVAVNSFESRDMIGREQRETVHCFRSVNLPMIEEEV